MQREVLIGDGGEKVSVDIRVRIANDSTIGLVNQPVMVKISKADITCLEVDAVAILLQDIMAIGLCLS